jgi:aspartate racemase
MMYTMHHIVSDGWSMGVMQREVREIYGAYKRGEESRLEELEIQYADYAAWQREWLQGETLNKYLGYWREHLEGAPLILDLPTDYSRPSIQRYRGAAKALVLPEELTSALKRLSRRQGATLFMTMMAAFLVLLRHYSGQDDIVIGSNTFNRSHPETEKLIGFFINQLVLRTKLDGDPGFSELLGRVRETALGAYAYQDLPFEKLVEELQPERDPGRPLLFQVKIEFQNIPADDFKLPGLTISQFEIENPLVRYDLHMFLTERGQELVCSLRYNTGLFEVSTIDQMLLLFQTILATAVEQPDIRLSEIEEMLADIKRRRQSELGRQLEEDNLRKLKSVKRKSHLNSQRAVKGSTVKAFLD